MSGLVSAQVMCICWGHLILLRELETMPFQRGSSPLPQRFAVHKFAERFKFYSSLKANGNAFPSMVYVPVFQIPLCSRRH